MINHNTIFKKIGLILNELQDQYEFLSDNPEQLTELELELFLANANFLTDHVEIVRKLHSTPVIKELPQQTVQNDEDIIQPVQQALPSDPVLEEIEIEELHQAELTPTFEFVIDNNQLENATDDEPVEVSTQDIQESVSDIPEVSKELEIDAIEKHEIPAATTQAVPGHPEIHEIPSKYFQTEPAPHAAPSVANGQHEHPAPQEALHKPTLNELLAAKSASTNSEEKSRPQIANLKAAITLNEKLLFIKDLFNGYNLAYSEAIDLMDKMPDYRTAETFLKNNYAIKNNWDSKQSTADRFYDLLRQRFGA